MRMWSIRWLLLLFAHVQRIKAVSTVQDVNNLIFKELTDLEAQLRHFNGTLESAKILLREGNQTQFATDVFKEQLNDDNLLQLELKLSDLRSLMTDAQPGGLRDWLQRLEQTSDAIRDSWNEFRAATQQQTAKKGIGSCGVVGLGFQIVGGTAASASAIPWQVGLYSPKKRPEDNPFCGGVIVGQRFVLTAAHCAEAFDAHDIFVVAGVTHRDMSQAPKAKINWRVLHPDWKSGDLLSGHDIALLRLEDGLVFSEAVSPVCLPDETTWPGLKANELLYASGWGYSDRGTETRPSQLQKAFLRRTVCANDYQQAFCASSTSSTTCAGDSGGPLTAKNKDGQHVLLGLVSGSVSGCIISREVVFTNVTAFLTWIQQNIASNEQSGVSPTEACSPNDGPESTPCISATISKITLTTLETIERSIFLTIVICSDQFPKDCCSLMLFEHSVVAQQSIVIHGTSLDECQHKVFKMRSFLVVNVTRRGDAPIILDPVQVHISNALHTSDGSLNCGRYELNQTDTLEQSHETNCHIGYNVARLRRVEIEVGDEVSNDNIRLKMCSDKEGPNAVCCEQALTSLQIQLWQARSNIRWTEQELEPCAKLYFNFESKMKFWVLKDGDEDLSVTKLEVGFEILRVDYIYTTSQFDCQGFSLKGDCVKERCSHALECVESAASSIASVPQSR